MPKQSRPALLNRLTWLGHDSFLLVTSDGKRVYFDPFKLGGKHLDKADLILVSHGHYDHLDKESLNHLRKAGTVIVGAPAVAKDLPEARIVKPGESTTVEGIAIQAVPAYNVNKFRSPGVPFHPKDPAESAGAGFVVAVDGEKLYHAGDTDHVPEMSELASAQIDVALLPVSGTYVMTAPEAAEAAKDIRPKVAVPMHYAAIVGSADDAQRFADLCRREGIEVAILTQK